MYPCASRAPLCACLSAIHRYLMQETGQLLQAGLQPNHLHLQPYGTPSHPQPPPTPTTLSPTSSDSKNPAKQENGVIKSERPSYARVAKAQPPSPPPPPPPRTLPSSATPSSPHPPLPSNQPKQCTPTSPQAKTGSSSSNSCNDTAVPSVVGNSQPSTASEGGTGTAQNSS